MLDRPGQVHGESTTGVITGGGGRVVVDRDEGQARHININIALRVEEGRNIPTRRLTWRSAAKGVIQESMKPNQNGSPPTINCAFTLGQSLFQE